MYETLIWFAIFNWGLPLLFWLYPLVALVVLQDIKFAGFYGPFVRFELLNGIDSWHQEQWSDWAGVGLFGFMVYRKFEYDEPKTKRTIKHEGNHCFWWMMLGVLFIVFYGLNMGWIGLFQPDKHPYLECWLERRARKAAGQPLDIKPEDWPQGPDDRCPWF